MNKYLLLLFILSFVTVAHSQEHSVISGTVITTSPQQDSLFKHQLQLVDSIRQFVRNDLKLKISNDFYRYWSNRKDSMYVYLYVSLSDTVKTPALVPENFWLFGSEDSATVRSNEFKKQGYQTLVYKTAGVSNAQLSSKLLSYPDEAIAFILFHEATHLHIGFDIEYKYIEALCDAMANAACVLFTDKTGMLDREKVLKQKMVFENAYDFLNKKRREVDKAEKDEKQKIFRECSSKVNSLIQHANQFAKDRMGYEVNNAYFLRVSNYAIHYFEMKQQLGDGLEIDKVTEGLPKVKKQSEPKTKSIELSPDFGSSLFPWNSK